MVGDVHPGWEPESLGAGGAGQGSKGRVRGSCACGGGREMVVEDAHPRLALGRLIREMGAWV